MRVFIFILLASSTFLNVVHNISFESFPREPFSYLSVCLKEPLMTCYGSIMEGLEHLSFECRSGYQIDPSFVINDVIYDPVPVIL
jgi:hypothetical protein